MLDLTRARDQMVDVHIARRGVRDRHVLDAMRAVPREAFVEPGFEEFAYEDGALPIGKGQTISQPCIVALMIEAAEVKPRERAQVALAETREELADSWAEARERARADMEAGNFDEGAKVQTEIAEVVKAPGPQRRRTSTPRAARKSSKRAAMH